MRVQISGWESKFSAPALAVHYGAENSHGPAQHLPRIIKAARLYGPANQTTADGPTAVFKRLDYLQRYFMPVQNSPEGLDIAGPVPAE